MKEFLNPEQNYVLVSCDVSNTKIPENWIEIPDGADIYISHNNGRHFSFYKFSNDGLNWSLWDEREKKYVWSDYSDKCLSSEYLEKQGKKIVWQRKSGSSLQPEKHSHYKKDVSHLELLDVYRVLELFEVKSHAVGHAVKKLLCSGNRGAKDEIQDIKEAIDSLNRHLEMLGEDDAKA